jgi:hypothetical protein
MSEKRFDKLEEKIERIVLDQQDFKVDISEIKVNLKEHMRRSTANEETNQLLREYIDFIKSEVDKKTSKYDKIIDRAKFLGIIVLSVGSFVGFLVKIGLLHF